MGRWLCLAGAVLGALGLLDADRRDRAADRDRARGPAMTANSGLGLLLIGGAAALRDREDAGPVREGAVAGGRAPGARLRARDARGARARRRPAHRSDHLARHRARSIRDGRRRRPRWRSRCWRARCCSSMSAPAPGCVRRSGSSLAAGFTALTALLGFIFGAELQPSGDPRPADRRGAADRRRPAADLGRAPVRASNGGADARGHLARAGRQQFRRFVLPAILIPIVVGVVVTFPLRGRRQ